MMHIRWTAVLNDDVLDGQVVRPEQAAADRIALGGGLEPDVDALGGHAIENGDGLRFHPVGSAWVKRFDRRCREAAGVAAVPANSLRRDANHELTCGHACHFVSPVV